MQRVGQTVGHFGTATCEAPLPKTWRILLRASHSNGPDGAMKRILWSRDEYILILELYFRFREVAPAKTDPILKEYSDYLRSMNANIANSEPKYRNENGIYMRLMNYRSCDPHWLNQGKVGMDSGSKGRCKEIWDEFSGDADLVISLADEIKRELPKKINTANSQNIATSTTSTLEGKKRLRIHYSRERSSQRKQKLAEVQNQKGKTSCEACNATDNQYSNIKANSIFEVHHIIPLSRADGEIETKLQDLAVLCANCHRAIHSINPMPSVIEFKKNIRHLFN